MEHLTSTFNVAFGSSYPPSLPSHCNGLSQAWLLSGLGSAVESLLSKTKKI